MAEKRQQLNSRAAHDVEKATKPKPPAGEHEDANGKRSHLRRSSLGTEFPGLNFSPSSDESIFDSKLDETSATMGLNMTVAATEPSASAWRSFLFLFVLLLITFLQCTLMATFFLATSLQPCSAHSDCLGGQYCCKCDNHCKDCADSNYRRSWIPQDEFDGYSSFCNATDKFPTRCDHIVKHATSATFFDQLGIVVSSFLLASHLIQDITEAHTENALLLYRARSLTNVRQQLVVRLFGWPLVRLRAYLLPFYVVGAVTSLIVMDSLKIHKVLVNFLAITFILEMDNLFNRIFLHPAMGDKTGSHIAAMNGQGLRIDWLASRVYIVAIAIVACAMILNIEAFMHLTMRLETWWLVCLPCLVVSTARQL